MRKPFKDAAAAIKASGYKCKSLYGTSAVVVFGGEAVIVTCSDGGTYYNRGPQYVAASMSVRARHDDDVTRKAFSLARAARPELFEALKSIPKSDQQATRMLTEIAPALDAAVAALLPQARAEIEAEQAEKERAHRAHEVRRAENEVAPELVAEVMRLNDEGLLDGSNALSGLKALAERIAAIRSGN